MLRKIKKKKYIVALLAVVIALVIIIHPMFAAAYPSTWDRYTNSSEGSINLDIYNGTKKIMDTYDTVTDIVPGSGEEPHGPENQGYPYTTWNIKDGKISKWYKSGYGPFLEIVPASVEIARRPFARFLSYVGYISITFASTGLVECGH